MPESFLNLLGCGGSIGFLVAMIQISALGDLLTRSPVADVRRGYRRGSLIVVGGLEALVFLMFVVLYGFEYSMGTAGMSGSVVAYSVLLLVTTNVFPLIAYIVGEITFSVRAWRDRVAIQRAVTPQTF